MDKTKNEQREQNLGSMINQKKKEDYNKEKPNPNASNFKNKNHNSNGDNIENSDPKMGEIKNGEIIQTDVSTNLVEFKRKLNCAISNKLDYPALNNGITEKVKYIEVIKNQNKQLRKIAWIQSHVVRAPLARMMGIINLFKEIKVVSPEQKILLDHIIASGEELDAVIKDITIKTKKQKIISKQTM